MTRTWPEVPGAVTLSFHNPSRVAWAISARLESAPLLQVRKPRSSLQGASWWERGRAPGLPEQHLWPPHSFPQSHQHTSVLGCVCVSACVCGVCKKLMENADYGKTMHVSKVLTAKQTSLLIPLNFLKGPRGNTPALEVWVVGNVCRCTSYPQDQMSSLCRVCSDHGWPPPSLCLAPLPVDRRCSPGQGCESQALWAAAHPGRWDPSGVRKG